MINFHLICGHCGSDYALSIASPRADAVVTCGVCGREGSFADWAAETERELSAQTNSRIHELAKGSR